ncbi:MAG: lactonase family protein [Luteolibacter sp.]
MIPKILPSLFLLTITLHAAPVFIGTNTGGTSKSKGIYLADFDSATGKLSEPKLVAEYGSPGFLVLHPTKPILYAVGRPTRPFPNGTSSVAAFSIGKDHSLKLLGEASTGGKDACHLAVDSKGRTVAVANYGDGHISTIRLDENGVPGEAVTVIANKGSGPNKSRQDGPHAHGVYFDKANKHLFVPDLGLDQVFVYPFDAAGSKLGEALPSLVTAPGAGPRHMTFSPDGKSAYVVDELDSTVTTASYDAASGKFTVTGTTPTLPADFTAPNTTAEIEVHPNGKFLYASNRGHDTIAVYRRDPETGALSFLQHAPCGGKAPRHFKIDPSGKWLLCGHQNSDDISVLALDPDTGLLGEPAGTVPSPSPICLLFAR